MVCKFCGNELTENEKFCRGCGANIEEADDAADRMDCDPIVKDEPFVDEKAAEAESVSEPVYNAVYEADNFQTIVDNDTKPLRKNPHVLISFMCFVFMLLIFGLEIVLGAFITINFTTSEKAVKKAISSLEITSLEIEVDGETKTFAEAIVGEITNENVSEKDVEKLIDEFEGEEYFSGVIAELTNYMFNGGEAPKLDGGELANVLESNKELIEDVTGEKISDDELDDFRKSADDFVADFNKNIEEMDIMEDMNGVTLSFGINMALISASCVIIVLILVLVVAYKLNGSGIYRVFKALTTPTFIAGILYLFVGIVAPRIIDGTATGSEGDMIVKLAESFAQFPLYAGIVLMINWLECLVAAIVLKAIYNKNTKA